MGDRPTVLEIRNQVRPVNRRLVRNSTEPSVADRSLWAELAVASFASVTGLYGDLEGDPETVLSDLLADLMHWCDARKNSGCLVQTIDFGFALKRARNHYRDESADKRQTPHTSLGP